MLITRLDALLKPVHPRSLPQIHLFLDDMNRKMEYALQRATHITPNGHGTRLLTELIKLADFKIILNTQQDIQDIALYVLSILRDLEKPIDPRVEGQYHDTLFIKSKVKCAEIITPTGRDAPLSGIPWEKPFTDVSWRYIHPLRIIDMSTTQLSLNVDTDYLIYNHQGPVYALYGVDCFALVMGFVSYYRTRGNIKDVDRDILDYLSKHVVTPALIHDNFALWLRNTYKQQLIGYSRVETHTSVLWDVSITDTLGSTFTAAMDEIRRIKIDLESNALTVRTALSSLPLLSNRTSFSKYYTLLSHTTTVPIQQPYIWVEVLKNMEWWHFMIILASFTPDSPDIISLLRDMKRKLSLWMMLRPWTHIHTSVPYRNLVMHRLNGLLDYLGTV